MVDINEKSLERQRKARSTITKMNRSSGGIRRHTTTTTTPCVISLKYYPWLVFFFIIWACIRWMDTIQNITAIFSFLQLSSSTSTMSSIPCLYDGHCPIGKICTLDGFCQSYLKEQIVSMDSESINNNNNNNNNIQRKRLGRTLNNNNKNNNNNYQNTSSSLLLELCSNTCLEELRIDEWYLHGSIPQVTLNYWSIQGGCVLQYQRVKKSSPQEASMSVPIEEWMQRRFRRVIRVDPNLEKFNNRKSSLSPSSSSSSKFNNQWIAYCQHPCETNEDCTFLNNNNHIQQQQQQQNELQQNKDITFQCLPTRKESTKLLQPQIQALPKSCQQQQRRQRQSQHQLQRNREDMYIISGANRAYFSGLKNLAASLLYWSPTRKLIIYNLGMTEDQLLEIQTSWPNVHHIHWKNGGIPIYYPDHVRKDLKNYAWKSIIINETVHQYKSIFWLDAGATFTGPVDPIEEIIHRHGLFLVHGQDEDMKRRSHPGTYQALGFDKETFWGGPHCAGGIQGHVYPSRYIDSIVIPNAKCALDESCIAPTGSSLQNHRYDQTSLSILAYNENVRAPHYTEYLAGSLDQLNDPRINHKNLSEPSSRFIMWTARQACKYYTKLGILKGS